MATSLALLAVLAPVAVASVELDVATINVWHGLRPQAALRLDGERPERREARLRALLAELRETGADLLFLQELAPLPRRAHEWADALGYDEVHQVDACGLRLGSCGVPTNLRAGLAILARRGLGLRRVGDVRLSGPGACADHVGLQLGESRHALLAEVAVGGERLLLVCTHLHAAPLGHAALDARLAPLERRGAVGAEEARRVRTLWEKHRARQRREADALAVAVERRLERGGYRAVLLGGDLNAVPGSAVLERLERSGLLRVSGLSGPPPVTWDPQVNAANHALGRRTRAPYPDFGRPELAALYTELDAEPRAIDHLLVRGALRATAVRRILDVPVAGSYLSDHFALRATLVMARGE